MLSIHFVLNSWLTKQVDPGDCGKGGRVVVRTRRINPSPNGPGVRKAGVDGIQCHQ